MKSVVFTFGRMNPPTTGHQLLVNKLMAYAKIHSAIPRIYLSHSVGKKDPIPYDKKISFARQAFGAIVRKSNDKNIIQILKSLEKEGFKEITMMVGSDRVPEFKRLLNAYNGKEYNFEKISIQSAGERDPDADDVSGMSASKMRALAKDNKDAEFMRGAPSTLKAQTRKQMYLAVRKAMLGEDVMDYGHDERFVGFIVEASDDQSDIAIPSREEIERYLEDVNVEDLDLADEDVLMYEVIMDIEDELELDEARVLSIQARQKLSQRMKGMSKRLARLRDIKRKQMPAQQRLRMRARKAALMMLRRRATGKKDLDYSSLSRSQRVAVDNALVNRFGKSLNTAVDRISKRILPSIRKKAQVSVSQARDVKEAYLYERESDKEGSAKDIATDKIQAAKRGISVSDWEKTKADAAHDSPLNINPLKLDTLSIDPTKNDRDSPNPKNGHLYLNAKTKHYYRVYEARKSASGQDSRDAGDSNIIYQMRKTINSRGEHETEFTDGHKMHVSIADAKKLLARYETLRLPNDKLRFTVMAASSMKNFKDILANGLPKESKKKISLGGKPVKEFYMGTGRNRTIAPYPQDSDEPPGTRRVAEAAKDEERPEDPNRSRPLRQKLDLLLRLGLADNDELQKYRRALRSSKKQALQSPEMREKLADLLDKLIDLTTQDPATYSRVRYRVMNKEAISLINKAEKSGIDVSILAEVFARGLIVNHDVNEAFNRVNSFVAGGKAVEIDSDLNEKVDLPQKYRAGLSDKTAAARKAHFDKADKLSDSDPRAYEPAPGDATAKTKLSKHTIKFKKMYGEGTIDESSDTGLAAKAKKSGISIGTLRKVYNRGMAAWNSGHRPGTTPQQWAMARVNSYIGKGKGTYHGADKDLREDSVDEACWDTHKQVGMKKKGNRMVPNCVPKEEHINEMPSVRSSSKGNLKGRLYDPNKFYHQTGYRLKSYRKPGETSKTQDKQTLDTLMKDFKGKVSVLPPGKKTAKSMIRPRDYMKPNPASRITEQTPAHKHPTGKVPYVDIPNKEIRDRLSTSVKAVNEIQRRADVKIVKVRMPDGTMKFRKERTTTSVQDESYTGSESTSSNPNDPTSRLVGTDAIRKNYENATPGQGSNIKKKTMGFREHNDNIEEATYKGKTVPLNKPMSGDVKKSKVYVDPDGDGKAKKVNFGDKTLSIKKGIPARKKSYCARSSGQGNLTDKTKANYWSRRAWNC